MTKYGKAHVEIITPQRLRCACDVYALEDKEDVLVSTGKMHTYLVCTVRRLDA